MQYILFHQIYLTDVKVKLASEISIIPKQYTVQELLDDPLLLLEETFEIMFEGDDREYIFSFMDLLYNIGDGEDSSFVVKWENEEEK